MSFHLFNQKGKVNETPLPPESIQEPAEQQEEQQNHQDAQEPQPVCEECLHKDQLLESLTSELHACKEDLRDEKLKTERLQGMIDELKAKLHAEPILEPTSEPQPVAVPVPEAQSDEKQEKPLTVVEVEVIEKMLADKFAPILADYKEAHKQLDTYINKYDTLANRVQEDRYRKDKSKILARLIRMRGLIKDILDDYSNEKMEGVDSPAALFLQKQLEALIVGLDADLRQELVIKMPEAKDGSDFNEDYQEAIGTELTDKEELAGKVHKSIAPGYYWSLPYILRPRVNENDETIHSYKFVLAFEQVITYQLKSE